MLVHANLSSLSLPFHGILSHLPSQFASVSLVNLHSWKGRVVVRLKCLVQEHNLMTPTVPGLELKPLNEASNMWNAESPRL